MTRYFSGPDFGQVGLGTTQGEFNWYDHRMKDLISPNVPLKCQAYYNIHSPQLFFLNTCQQRAEL